MGRSKADMLWIFLGWICQITRAYETAEVCNGEQFNATCPPNTVLLIRSALYGRMQLGRCVSKDWGYLGCNNDALSAVESACAGKSSCHLTVSNQLRQGDSEMACERELAGYAKIEYECLKVQELGTQHCHGTEMPLTSASTYIASSSIARTCSTLRKLQVSVYPGQTMQISLLSFDDTSLRLTYGTARDKVSGNTQVLISGSRQKEVMLSVGNAVELDFAQMRSVANFLIHIQVLGCKDIAPPEGTWTRRDNQEMQVGCDPGSKVWTLTCDENEWKGVLGHCGTGTGDINLQTSTQAEWHLKISMKSLIFGLGSLFILIGACVFLGAVCYLKRNRKSKFKHKDVEGPHAHPLLTGPTHLGFSTMPTRHDTIYANRHDLQHHNLTLGRIHNPQRTPTLSRVDSQGTPVLARMDTQSTPKISRNEPQRTNTLSRVNTMPIYRPLIDVGDYHSLQKHYLGYPGVTPVENPRNIQTSHQNSVSDSVKYYVLEDFAQATENT